MRCPIMVGRDRELGALVSIARQAADGCGGAVVVTGEAGVGKTRLVTEVAGCARDAGQVVLVGRSTPMDRASPLRPLAEAMLNGLRDRRPPDDSAFAPYLPALGILVPHWSSGTALTAAVPPVVLAEAILRAVRWLSPDHGALVVLEDLHWADSETLAVLAYLVDHVADFPVCLVVTIRSDEAETSGMRSVLTRNLRAIDLGPLAEAEVAVMAAACLGVEAAPAAILAGLRNNAAGLPLLIEDLVGVSGRPVPVRYGEIISARLASLDGAARELVTAAAVLGTEIDQDLLATVTALTPPAWAEAMAEARLCGLVSLVGARIAFRHALVRELVLAGLAGPTRAEVARRAAEALEASPEARVVGPAHVAELWIQCGEVERAVGAFRRAAHAARDEGAIATAEALVRRALTIAPLPLMPELRLDLLDLIAAAGRVGELAALGAEVLDDLGSRSERIADVHLSSPGPP